jgi:NitT/TauT family transport system permease protein
VSIIFGLVVGIAAARNKAAESVILPTLDVFQSIPILGFFPFALLVFVAIFPVVGTALAVIFLVFTSMVWNIAFGVYEAVKSIPENYLELSRVAEIGPLRTLLYIYLPAAMPKVAYNSAASWAIGLFYLISSEIISLSGKTVPVRGIGVDIVTTFASNDTAGYVESLVALIVAVVIWRYVFIKQFSLWADKFKFTYESMPDYRDVIYRFYTWVYRHSLKPLLGSIMARISNTEPPENLSRSLRTHRKAIVYTLGFLGIMGLTITVLYAILSVRTVNFSNVLGDEWQVLVALGASFVRVWYVYVIMVVVGLPVGILMALSVRLYESLFTILEVVASIPAPALLPPIALAFSSLYGSGEIVAMIVIFLGSVWYIIFNVMAGMRSLPRDLWDLREVLHVSRKESWRGIYIPASMTSFVTGSITAVGGAWNTLIVAEYFSANGKVLTQVGVGIGKLIDTSSQLTDLTLFFLCIVSMTILIVVFDLTVWRKIYNYTTRRFSYSA